MAAGVAVHGHAAVGFLHGALLLLQHIGDWLQLLKPVLGGPLSLFLGGLLVPPGHVVGVDHVRLEGRLGKNSLAGLLVDQVAGLAAGAERQIDASFRLLHMDSVSSGASSEVLRAVSSEVLMAASAGVLRAISAAEGWRAASSYLGDLVDASSEDCGVASAAEDWIWVPSGGELVGSFMLSVGSFTR